MEIDRVKITNKLEVERYLEGEFNIKITKMKIKKKVYKCEVEYNGPVYRDLSENL